MGADVAHEHELHGLQPVLPVPDVDAAAAWFRDRLGFRIEFSHGTPARHARVTAGDGSWGAPVYVHLARSEAPVVACGELRLHVGRGLDALYAALAAARVPVLLAPVDQTWGLREFVVEAPGGHRLRLCGETTPTPATEAPRAVVVNYRPKPGQAAALLELVRGHVPALQRLGLATMRAPFVMQAGDGSLVEVFEWASAAAIAAAHDHPDVQALWARFGAACDYGPLAGLPEAAGPFAEFASL